jgi:hypothetical protein
MKEMVLMFDEIDQKGIDVTITKIGEAFAHISKDARRFIKSNLVVDDVLLFEKLLENYQYIIRQRFYVEPDDEDDYETIVILKYLLELLYVFLG